MDERTVFQSAPPGSVKPGVRLNGIYEIESLIAKGGMGEVYKGFNILTGDPVAIKMILPDLARNEDAFNLFKREASTLHNLQHEAIVRYYVFSRDPGLDRAYLAMEFVDGVSLAKRLASGAMPVADVRVLQTRVAGALEAAHQLGVVHRDISSDNIILPGGDVRRAKVIDFGIAKSLKPGEGTIIGDGFAGKYKYVSPEQLGLAGGVVGPKSDIYSLGLVLAEALRGAPLDMGGSQAEVIDKRRAVPDLSDVPATMRPLLQAMLQPRPEDRPASMAAVAQWSPSQTSAKSSAKSSESRAPNAQRASDGATKGGSGGTIAAILGGLILLGGVGAAGYFLRDDIAALIAPGPSIAPGPAPSARPTLAPSPSPAPTLAKLPPLPTPSAASIETPTPTQTGALATPTVEPTLPPSATPTPAQTVAHVPTGAELADQLPPSPEAASVTLPRGAVGKPYRASTPAFADPGGMGLTLRLEPAPPPGLALKDLGGGHGEIAGTPTKAASGEFSIIAKNHNGRTAQTLAMIVIDDGSGEAPKPSQTPTPRPSSSAASTPAPPTPASAPTPKTTPSPVASILPTLAPSPIVSIAPTLAASPLPTVAPTPEATPTPSKDAASSSLAAKAAAFAAAFDGGPCFMIRPRGAPEQLEFQGVGVDVAPFQRFDAEFTKTIGADAKIGLRMIAPQQCPALALLKSDPVGAGDPRLDLASLDISAGKALAGEIRNLAGRSLTLLIVTNDGASVKIDAARQAGDDRATFSVPLTPDAKSVKTLQMLLAIVSPKPLKALEGFKAGSTADIIPKVEAEFGPANANVDAEFFRVGN